MYMGQTVWKHPQNPALTRNIYVVGFDPADEVFALPGVTENLHKLHEPDVVLYAYRDSFEGRMRIQFIRVTPERLEPIPPRR